MFSAYSVGIPNTDLASNQHRISKNHPQILSTPAQWLLTHA